MAPLRFICAPSSERVFRSAVRRANVWRARWTASPTPRTDQCPEWHRWPERTTEETRHQVRHSKSPNTSCCQLTGEEHLERSTNNRVLNASTCSYSSTSQAVQTQFVSQFAHSHCVWKILFVSKHQNNGVFQLVLLDLMTPWT